MRRFVRVKTKNDGNAVRHVRSLVEEGWDAVKATSENASSSTPADFYAYLQSENQMILDSGLKARKKQKLIKKKLKCQYINDTMEIKAPTNDNI